MAEGTIQRRLSIPPGGDQSINLFDWSENSGATTPDSITGIRRGRGTSVSFALLLYSDIWGECGLS
jgi:hypothetical protein